MTTGVKTREKVRRRLRVALAVIAVLVLALVVPPLINVNHYKGRIVQLISQSLGRPVRLSSVQVRLLPWPGFELSNLSVAEDPAYGAEPVLYANQVIASIRLLALLGGRVEIGKISVDDASLNLVRAGPGRWNLDPLFRTAAAQTGSATGAHNVAPLPYLEATNSRIDFKNGTEKLPFSLVNADLSFWQENPGEWRLRLRGQPARTDVSIYQEETGIVRIEASVRRAPALRLMPLHLDLDWREAQLGQLARIVTGSDPGWRGNLTGELHLDGSPDTAQITIRLRAAGVHRAEFTPTSPLDFDANCAFAYHYAQRSLQNLACDSPLGDGRIHVTGEKLGEEAPPSFSVALDRIPVAAGLDALRTFRSGINPDLEASGTVSGKIIYEVATVKTPQTEKPAKPARNHLAKAAAERTGPLTGSLSVSGFVLRGGGLTRPIQSPKVTLEPIPFEPVAHGQPGASSSSQAIAGSFTIPAGGAVPLTLNVRLSLSGYRAGVRGQASFARAREIANAAGIPRTGLLAALAGNPIAVDLTAEGPWMPTEQLPLPSASAPQPATAAIPASQALAAPGGAATVLAAPAASSMQDTLSGTVTVRDANWKADYLASHLTIAEATLHLGDGELRWDPVAFSYGPLKGTASLTVPLNCPADEAALQPCPPQFQVRFGDLDAAAFQTALLGAREKSTLLSGLIERFHPSTAPPWPRLEGTVTADSLVLGAVTLQGFTVAVRVLPTGAQITSLDAGLLGGNLHATGSIDKPANDKDKPDYTFEGDFQNLNSADLGRLLGLRWTGDTLSGNGKVELSGYTAEDLGASAKGALQFEARRGAIAALKTAANGDAPKSEAIPVALARFDHLTADAVIANGAIQLGQNQVASGARKHAVQATITFGNPPRITFTPPTESPAKRH